MARMEGWARVFLSTMIATTAVACGGSESPAGPTDDVLALDSYSTATDLDPLGIRIQVRMHVTAGLSGLSAAVAAGVARIEVCQGSVCATSTVSTDASERECSAANGVGANDLRIAGAWLHSGDVGVDFCVREIGDSESFALRVLSGAMVSNVTQTFCSRSNAFGICGSN